jgi:hypothetical protein
MFAGLESSGVDMLWFAAGARAGEDGFRVVLDQPRDSGAAMTSPSPFARSSRRRRGAVGALVVLCTLLGVAAAGCSFGHRDKSPHSAPVPDVTGHAWGEPVSVKVSPDQPFTVTVPGAVVIEGVAGSVSGSGTITAQALDGDAADSSAVHVAGHGVDVTFDGTTLTRRVTVTFLGVALPGGSAETRSAVLHQRDDGRTEILPAQALTGDRLRFQTRSFSPNFPINIDLGRWFSDRFDSLADLVSGRTDPDRCAGGAPSWATLTSTTDMVHACAITNADSAGRPRAEVQFKTNRRFWMVAQVPRGAAYVWVKDQPDPVRTALAELDSENRDNYVFLKPGDGVMTAGYYQPADGSRTVRFEFGTDGLSQLLSLTNAMLGGLDVGGRPALAAAALLVAKCKEEVPGLLGGFREKFLDFLGCVGQEVAGQLSDSDKAFAAAMNLFGDAGYARDASNAVSKAKSGLQILGWFAKAAGVLAVLRNEAFHVVDEVVALIAPASTAAQLTLDRVPQPAGPGTPGPGTPTPPVPTPTPTPPPPPAPGGNPVFNGGYVIQDDYLGGTWPRTDPNDGTWYSHSNRPANAASYWWANGLGVGFACGAHAAGYYVRFADGHRETWNTWFRSTDTWGGRVVGLWVPSAVAAGIVTDGLPPGMPTC